MSEVNPGTPPVTPPASTPPPVTPPAAAASGDWTTTLNDETKTWVTNKGFKDPGAVIESYRNFEKLQGVPQDRILKLPESLESPEGRAVWEKLGLPKESKDYDLKRFLPKEGGDPQLTEWAEKVFHDAGVPAKMAEKIIKNWNDRQSNDFKKWQDESALAVKSADENLRKEWGAAYDQNKIIADNGARALGLKEVEVQALGQALGPDKAMQLLHRLGVSTGEAQFVTGENGSGIMSPASAQAEIKSLMQDGVFNQRLNSGDVDAKRQWENLHKQAFPGMASL